MNYEIIPQAPRYELSDTGILRNRETGRILKWTPSPKGTKTVTLCWGGKKICATLPSLMWQLHGRILSKKCPVPVVISRNTRTIRFDSLEQCARYLNKYHDRNFGSCRTALSRRAKHIGDWNVRYCY